MRDEGHEPDTRWGSLGTRGHATTKSSIHRRGVLYTSGVYARTVGQRTAGGLSGATGSGVPRKLAERGASRVTPWEESANGRGGRQEHPEGRNGETEDVRGC
jgi:hypothetical protein